MLYSIIMFSTAALLIVPALFLLAGRGAFLIAGYNTASAVEKTDYNEKRLCRVIGAGTLMIGILVLIMAFLGENMSRWFVIVTLVITGLDVVAMLLLCNSRWVRTPAATDTASAPRQKNKAAVLIATGVTAVSLILVCIVLFGGEVEYQYNDDYLLVDTALWTGQSIHYADINSIELREGISPGRRISGADTLRVLAGYFRNEEFGNYIRYTYTTCDTCVVLQLPGKTLVLGGENATATRAIYDALRQRLS